MARKKGSLKKVATQEVMAAKETASAAVSVDKLADEKPVSKMAEPEAKEEVSLAAEVVKPTAKEEASAAAEAEKPVETKPAPKKEETKGTPGRKPSGRANAKKNTKKAPVETVEEVYLEFNNEQFLLGDVVNRIKENYKNEGHRISSIKSLKVYVDPVQRKAYYVINDKPENKYVDL